MRSNVISTIGNQTYNGDIFFSNNIQFTSSAGNFTALPDTKNHHHPITFKGTSLLTPTTSTPAIFPPPHNSGGNITLISPNGRIQSGKINSSGTSQGRNIRLEALQDIEVKTLDSRSSNGVGGNINIATLGKLRVTGIIEGTNSSINSSGSVEGGSILINFFPDNPQGGVTEDPHFPFTVSGNTDNGTTGTITSGEYTIAEGEFFNVVEEGNIGVILLDPVEPLQPPTPPTTPPVQTPVDSDNSSIEDGGTDNSSNTSSTKERLPFSNSGNDVIQPSNTIANTTDDTSTYETSDTIVIRRLDNTINTPILSISESRVILQNLEKEVDEKPAFIYVSFTPKGYQPSDFDADLSRREISNTNEYRKININVANLPTNIAFPSSADDLLDILIITNEGNPIPVVLPVTRQQVIETARNLWSSISDPFALDDSYKPYASG